MTTQPVTIRRVMRWRICWAWVTRYWPLAIAALFVAAAFDPSRRESSGVLWVVVWGAAAVSAVALVVFPVDWRTRYAACVVGGTACAGRAFTIAFSPHLSPVSWVAVASWLTIAVLNTTLLALSWWVALHFPRPPGDTDGT